MDRIEKALHLINREGLGLEIGPSHRPIAPKKAGFNVEILDHATAEELRKKYQGHNLKLDDIEEVDYVWKGEPLDELVGKIGVYDYIIASHVIEHTTNIIGFLQQCSKLLKPNGVLSLIIPDKRYFFDYLRPISTTGDCLQAYFENRTRHPVGVIFDYFSSVCHRNGIGAWDKSSDQGELKLIHTFGDATHFMEIANDADARYIDVHQWRLIPSSFKLILNDLQRLNLVDLYESISFDTDRCEFYITLSKNPVAASDRLKLYKSIMSELSVTSNLLSNELHMSEILGFIDTISLSEDNDIKLTGWAANEYGLAVDDLKVMVGGIEIPASKLKRVNRIDVSSNIKNILPFCGFELYLPFILLPKLERGLSIVAKNLETGSFVSLAKNPGFESVFAQILNEKNEIFQYPIVFIHIPKTAGTSFIRAIEKSINSNLICKDYGKISNETSDFISEQNDSLPMELFKNKFTNKGFLFFAGHFDAIKYLQCFEKFQFATFVREPVSRIVSEYNHLIFNEGYKPSFLEFIKIDAKKQQNMLSGIKLYELGFLGITEYYEKSIKLFNITFNVNLELDWVNASNKQDYYLPSKREIAEFKKINRSEFIFYKEAVKEFNVRCDKYNIFW